MESYETQIQKAIDYIEEDVMEKQTLRNLAHIAGFSEYHFHRVFQAMVGDSVMEYVRKRRLAQAAYQLSHTDEKIIDVALEHGFQSHETFTRAFKKLFQMTPSAYRKQEIKTPMYYKVNVKQRKLNPYLGGIQMEFRIEKKPAFLVAGYEMKTTSKEGENLKDIPAFWDHYLQKNLADHIPNRKDTSQYVELGMCTDFNLEAGDFTYIIGMEVTDFENMPSELTKRTFPEATYAVFTTPKVPHKDMVASIQQTWNAVFSEWFPHSGYEHAGVVEFELYDERCHEDKSEFAQIELWLPVQKKQ
ncbi:AraC family transcriptional regulator [Bacillus pseudomycoides]|uniref:AraC family transcriptional regulator n=1 Tax=Bacillus pseudomycoides TaxID=64104 RepID=A0AA91ZT72_9BACI|nr:MULTISPECIES: AraC family transcriptional regulator [Bacillus]PEB52184.1 AraC family transcriptional regulator [Bacillus sp. AFS098217]PED82284.1 AraC family transcriptional regulator [Bacillus pseudomycoides]PEU10223.1 AraC family transcriptional regulator [Bacillus sp. AFS014408]PEU12753.1 AraC family transcriptional regulator [Bacillus sp. AFS019443]PFW63267.1 AraC family transcriptional regulator [Bacillus sp. AFS075034]